MSCFRRAIAGYERLKPITSRKARKSLHLRCRQSRRGPAGGQDSKSDSTSAKELPLSIRSGRIHCIALHKRNRRRPCQADETSLELNLHHLQRHVVAQLPNPAG